MKIDLKRIGREALGVIKKIPYFIARNAFIFFIAVLILEIFCVAFIFYHYGFPEETGSTLVSGPATSEFEKAVQIITTRGLSRERAKDQIYFSPFSSMKID